MDSCFVIRPATEDDLPFFFSNASSLGWVPGLHDIETFYKFDPDGFFVGCSDNEIVACISAVSYNASYGFIGFYIVKEGYRGKGYGIQMWRKAIAHMGDRCVGLDGVVEQQPNYMKSGFHLACNNCRFKGNGSSDGSMDPRLVDLKDVAIADLIAYDSQLCPVERGDLLRLWRMLPDSLSVCYFDYGDSGSAEIKGYGVVRKCVEGYRIGPLFADNADIYRCLLSRLRQFVGKDDYFYIDVPMVNETAVAISNEMKLTPCFDTARMYLNGMPSFDLNRVYGLTSLELG